MSKIIRRVDELPKWFDIRPYEDWLDEDPNEAAWAVNDRLFTAWHLYVTCVAGKEREDGYCLATATIEKAHNLIAQASKNPYKRYANEILMEILSSEDIARHGQEHADLKRREHEEDLRMEDVAEREVLKIFGNDLPGMRENGISRVTLWDVNNWMEKNKEFLEEVERSANRIAQENGWDIDEVRSSLSGSIPLWSEVDGSDFIALNDYPTVPAVLQRLENHLLKRPFKHLENSSARYSDVRKLFDYRVAAYADLTAWSHLSGCTITKKCMANALFPDGRYGELDMQPSKTVGRFIKRLEEGYIEDLTAKSAEMKSMQS